MDRLTELQAKYGDLSYKFKAIQQQIQALEQELNAEYLKQNGKKPEVEETKEP